MNASAALLLKQRVQTARAEVAAACGLLGTTHSSPNAAVAQQKPTAKRQNAQIIKALRQLCSTVDAALQALWQAAGLEDKAANILNASVPALVAVGGFGRADLLPYSDIDVLILLPAAPSAAQGEQISAFVSACWDAGLEIGSSVRTVDEALSDAASDLTVQTALLERRRVCGNAQLFAQLGLQLDSALQPQIFYQAKLAEMAQRHQKFELTPYALEPNCKESPGGLRDLHVILWVAKAAGLGRSWVELEQRGLVTRLERLRLVQNHTRLTVIRAALHSAAGRHEDRLVFDLQTQIATALGYSAQVDAAAPNFSRKASEALMRQYYWAAKAVVQLNQIVLQNIQAQLSLASGQGADDQLQPINTRFVLRAGLIDLAHDAVYAQTPPAILETFLLYQQHEAQGLSVRVLRALYHARGSMNAAFRANATCKALFMQILQQPSGITHALRLMNQTSVLGRYLWPFRRIVGQMQHDLFHVYTVDQHILMVQRNVRRFFLPEHAHEYPFCSQLASQWDAPWLLVVAALFHDIGKGRGGDHSQIGEVEVRRFCKQHGVAAADTALLALLVREHLTMSQVAQKQDLSDPDVIAAFAKRVGTVRNLTALYLLTVADVRGTSPKVWNSWKAKLLEDLFRLARRAVQSQELAVDVGSGVRTEEGNRPVFEEDTQSQAARVLAERGMQPAAVQALWRTWSVSYFMRHEADEVVWHTEMLAQVLEKAKKGAIEGKDGETEQTLQPGQPLVFARPSPHVQGLQVLVYTPSKAGVFARICGAFEALRVSVLDAKIHTTQGNGAQGVFALDSFEVLLPPELSGLHGEDAATVAREIAAFTDHLCRRVQAALGEVSGASHAGAPMPKPRLSRRAKSFPIPPRVSIAPDERGEQWILSVSTHDRIGLLYTLARVLAEQGVSITLAKISTLGERVEDTFLLDAKTLSPSQTLALEQTLLAALNHC